MTEICRTLLIVSVDYARGVGWGVCILPPATFKNVFDAYNFSIILNLFDSNKPSALDSKNLVLYRETHFYMRFKTIYAVIFQRKNFNAWKTMTNSLTNFILKFKFLWLTYLIWITWQLFANRRYASKIIAYVQFTYHVKCLKHGQFSWNLF